MIIALGGLLLLLVGLVPIILVFCGSKSPSQSNNPNPPKPIDNPVKHDLPATTSKPTTNLSRPISKPKTPQVEESEKKKEEVSKSLAGNKSEEEKTEKKEDDKMTKKDQKPTSTEFALALLKAASNGKDNFAISPFSLGSALAMVHDGAKEGTQQELTKLLGKDLSASEVSALYATLTAALSEENSAVVTSVANRFFLDKEFSLKPEYAAHVAKTFGAGAESLNFKDGDASANHVNAFVEASTCGMIREAITPDAFADDAAAVLVNAVYFKGDWKAQFDKADTETKPFHGVAGDREAQFMFAEGLNARHSLSDDLAVVSLAYADPAYELVVLMPTGKFGAWRDGLTADALQAAIEGTAEGDINLSLPKFKIESKTDGKAALEQLGVHGIFSRKANLTGISDQDLRISKIMHKAVIEVTETGTEAAASTGVVYVALCGPNPDAVDVIIDKPYIYLLKRGADILFIGEHCK